MKWIIDFFGKQPVSSDRAMHVGSLKRNDDLGKVEVLKNLNVPQSRFDHRFGRRRAVLLQQILFERATVDADANWHLLCLCGADHFDDALVLADVAGIEA